MQNGKTTSAAVNKAGQVRVLFFLFALAAFLAPALSAHAASVSASLSVSVFVPARAVLSVESQPAGLEITEEVEKRPYSTCFLSIR